MVKRVRTIFLVGLSGSGKTSVGPILAKRLKGKFLDTDHLIERQEGCSITEIFAADGERYFRQVEHSIVQQLMKPSRSTRVVALGGGAFSQSTLRRSLLEHGVVVYLSCSVRELCRRLRQTSDRPLLAMTDRKSVTLRIQQLLAKRKSHYEQADLRCATTSKTPIQAAREIVRLIKRLT